MSERKIQNSENSIEAAVQSNARANGDGLWSIKENGQHFLFKLPHHTNGRILSSTDLHGGSLGAPGHLYAIKRADI
ncbi:hypothetical protein TNCV_504451 [Trichonephila clavipes]|nr:hypothetical protein TNCV_504451 [Trichonephila clavipes]